MEKDEEHLRMLTLDDDNYTQKEMKDTHSKNWCRLSETSLEEKTYVYTTNKKSSPIHKTAEKTLLSPIPSTLTSLLQPNKLMEGNDIEDFLSLLISTNPNMSFMATHLGPHLRQYGET
jgi:hypothetical protein